jgi:hypothetical protein
MASHYHAVVWVDHHEARVIFFNPLEDDETVIHPEHEPRHIHSKAGSAAGTHLRGNPNYFAEIASALAPAGAVLVTGPSTAKTEFVTYLHDHTPLVSEKLAGVETLDKTSDPRLVAFARRHFKSADRMTPQSSGHR